VADTFGAESALRFELTVSARGDGKEKKETPPAKAASSDDERDGELADAERDELDEAEPADADEAEAEEPEAEE
jgi:hypothetical protein